MCLDFQQKQRQAKAFLLLKIRVIARVILIVHVLIMDAQDMRSLSVFCFTVIENGIKNNINVQPPHLRDRTHKALVEEKEDGQEGCEDVAMDKLHIQRPPSTMIK